MSKDTTEDQTDQNSFETKVDSVAAYVPGAAPGSQIRNALVALVYIGMPVLIPFALAYAFGTNKGGITDEFSDIPGFGSNAVVPAAIAFIAGLVIYAMVASVLPWAGTDSTGDTADVDEPEATGEEEAQAATGDDSDAETDESDDADATDGTDEAGDDPPPEADESDDVDESEATTDDSEPEAEAADENGFSEHEAEQLFERTIEEQGYEVNSVEQTDNGFMVESTSYAADESELASEMGAYGGAYAGIVERGQGDGGMVVYVHNAQGELAFTFSVEEEWAEQYNEGEISGEEYGELVFETIETYQ